MKLIIGILIFLVVILFSYIFFIQSQIRTMNKQLNKRLKEKTAQPINLNLFNNNLNELASNMNRCFKAEENLRLKAIKEEKRFKEMIANLSHDLRTPLTAIKGYQQLIKKTGLEDKQREKLEIAMKHTEELGELIEHFFEYSYYLNVEPKVNLEELNLTNIVAECLVASINAFEDKGLSVEFQETQPIFIVSDKELVNRIVQNLISNCLKHSQGDVKVKLIAENKTIISFQNPIKNSSNIDPSKLFDRFYTGDKARSNSTGLGLSIVKLLAEKMGGSAEAYVKGDILDIRVKL
ncbi:sensor histidine kinase [Clostridium sp. LP20]|uniref:sensor histidine kinase n=1 Tax=Clostridium sp. LP20 TaxID=3418665 RepID=UPI003EE72F55